MYKAPKTVGGEITEELNSLIAKSDRFRDRNSPEILELNRRIRLLQKADAREAFVCFGAVAAICGQVDEVFEYYRKALLLPGEAVTKREFWSSMTNVGLYDKAAELGTWLLEPRHGFFPQMWPLAVATGQILAVWTRLPDAMHAYPELSDVDFSAVERAAHVMKERNLTDENIATVFALMGEVQRSHKIMFADTLPSVVKVVTPPEDPPYLYFTVPIASTLEEVHAMSRELATLIVEKAPGGAFPSGIVASFTRPLPVELRAAA